MLIMPPRLRVVFEVLNEAPLANVAPLGQVQGSTSRGKSPCSCADSTVERQINIACH